MITHNLNDLDSFIQINYPQLIVSKIEPLLHVNINSKNFLIYTNKGKFVLHNFRDNTDIIKFEKICKILEFCSKHNVKVIKPLLNKDGKYANKKNKTYLTNYVDGEKFNGSIIELKNVAKNLALLHKALKKIKIKYDYRVGQLFYKNLDDTEFTIIKKVLVKKKKTTIDNFILKNLNYIENITERDTEFTRSLNKVNLQKQLIHFDVQPGNVIFKNGKVNALLDFDSMRSGYVEQDVSFACMRFAASQNMNQAIIKNRVNNFLQIYIQNNGTYELDRHQLGQFAQQLFLWHINYILRKRFFYNSEIWSTDFAKHLYYLKISNKIWPTS